MTDEGKEYPVTDIAFFRPSAMCDGIQMMVAISR